MITLKKQVNNLMKEGLGTKQIYERLKATNPTTTYGSIAYNICIIKKQYAEKTTNEQTESNQS